MPVTELEESSLSLDETLLRFMDQLELLQQKRATLNSLIEQGWFSMSKARYSMGNKQVSSLQYASEMEPLVCVHARTQVNGDVDFRIERVEQGNGNKAQNDERSIEVIGPQDEGIRRRIKPPKDINEEGASGEKAPEVTPVNACDKNPHHDPLKWFGILVPQSLKQAQSSFKQVIPLSAEIAALQTAVLNTRQELKCRMKEKHILQEKASEAEFC